MKPISTNVFSHNGVIELLVIFLLITAHALAQSGGDYTLTWSTIDGGGGQSSGGQYTLTGTIGQPDAAWSSGGQYELLGGFWPGGPLCFVDFESYARFAEWWLEPDCNKENNWCGGADLDKLGNVDHIDLDLLVKQWLCYCPPGWPLK